jgi:hypothetical protein
MKLICLAGDLYLSCEAILGDGSSNRKGYSAVGIVRAWNFSPPVQALCQIIVVWRLRPGLSGAKRLGLAKQLEPFVLELNFAGSFSWA